MTLKGLLRVCVAALLAWAPHAPGQGVDPSLRWRTLDTDHFSVHFPEQLRAQAGIVAAAAEGIYPRVTAWLKWKPESRTQLIVLDSADFANGLASPLPFNYSAIFLSPPDEGELLQNREWLDLVLTHEFTHIVHMDKASRGPLAIRRIFGRFPLPGIIPVLIPFPSAFPNVWQPRWALEGLAVYAETEESKGWGRLGNSYFEGMMRAEVWRGMVPFNEILAGGRGFPFNRDYLYGSYFFKFLAERYGEGAIIKYVENYSDDMIPFRVHTNPRAVTGKTMEFLWHDYQLWLHARFGKPVERTDRSDDGGKIIARAFSLTSPELASSGARWYVQSDGYTMPQLVRQAPGKEPEPVREIERDARLAAMADGVLIAQPEICGNYNYYYDLYRLDAEGDFNRLTECGRFRFAVPLAEGRVVAIRVVAGHAEVVVLNRQGAVERTLYRAAPGEALSGLAANERTVVITALRDGRWSLVEIVDGKASVLLADEAVKHTPRFGGAGEEIYFVADYGKVYNVWSWRPATRTLARWTHALNGVREISAPVAGEMLVTTIEADGDVLRLHRLPETPHERREAIASAAEPPPAPPPLLETKHAEERAYSPFSSLLPRWWFPIIYAADGALAFGVQTSGQDALGLHNYVVAPMYELSESEALGFAEYVYDGRHGLVLDRQMTVRATNSDDTEIRAYAIHEAVQWVSTWEWLSLGARVYWGLGAALERERLHEVGKATSAAQNERVAGLVAGVDTRRAQRMSEGPSQGQQLRLFAETSDGLDAYYSGNVYRGDWRVHFPLGKTVLALRWNEAYGEPEAEPFRLGGSRTDPATTLPLLNQREFALRGYLNGEPALTGHRARIGTIEWRVPLADVDSHYMVPPVGMNRLSMNLFFEAGDAWDKGDAPHYHRGAGLELMWEVRVGYLFGAQARLGVARGLDENGETRGYVKVGRSF